jgi:Ca2+-binding RTX toxin-like protein
MRAVLACVLVPLTLLSPVPEATAQAATCHGLVATIEGPGPEAPSSTNVTGTAGDDVIVVTGGVDHVDAGAGDDLICLVDNDLSIPTVSAGSGSDLIDATQAGSEVETFLDVGSDTFIGGPERDIVNISGGNKYVPGTQGDDSGVDVVSTGGGQDLVYLYVGSRLKLNTGADRDALFVINAGELAHGSGTLNLGSGHDVVFAADKARVDADLQREKLRVGSARYDLERNQDVSSYGGNVTIRGSGDANTVAAYGCNVSVSGGDGRDLMRITARPQWSGLPALRCAHRSYRLDGQGGGDQLTGSVYNDVLVGGPGIDTADGNLGKDTCAAEQKVACES